MRVRLSLGLLLVLAIAATPAGASVKAATSRPSISTALSRTLVPAAGGTFSLLVRVHGATKCVFSSRPAVAGFSGTVPCEDGTLARSGLIRKSSSKRIRSFRLEVTAINGAEQKRVTQTVEQAARNATAYLDPTFSQSRSNPLEVTWCASVNDDAETSPCQYDNGSGAPRAATEDPTLAPGVLDFYVGPVNSTLGLVCSTNVSRSIDFADCKVNLAAVGDYTVVTEYLSKAGDSSATETSNILAFTTSTAIAVPAALDITAACTPGNPCTSTFTGTVSDQFGDQVNVSSSGLEYQPTPSIALGQSDLGPNGTSTSCVVYGSIIPATQFAPEEVAVGGCGNGLLFFNPPSSFSISWTGQFLSAGGYATSTSTAETMVVNVA